MTKDILGEFIQAYTAHVDNAYKQVVTTLLYDYFQSDDTLLLETIKQITGVHNRAVSTLQTYYTDHAQYSKLLLEAWTLDTEVPLAEKHTHIENWTRVYSVYEHVCDVLLQVQQSRAIDVLRCHVGTCGKPVQELCLCCGCPVCDLHSTIELADMTLQTEGYFCDTCWRDLFLAERQREDIKDNKKRG
jgi:hypothetical protein